ncbi:MAG TPA: tetratricopeptide repeat protein, partial [Stellaceae bacterium]|nr:tetratricopeptide repeat protein [Stellaceae bacterium]
RDAGDHLKAALTADPRAIMAQLVKGFFLMLFSTRTATARATAAAEAAAALAGDASERERRHLAALNLWTRGALAEATATWHAILQQHPRDLLAVKLGQYGAFYGGDAEAMRAVTGTALAGYDESVPGYSWVLGSHAFSLEEGGAYDAAEAAGRRAVALDPADIWAAHAVAHVCEMQDRIEDGVRWIAGQEGHWGNTNNFRFHAFWHRSLFLLALGRTADVLALYDREVRAESTDDYLDISNAVSLLWRLEETGVDVGGRWAELAQRSRAHLADHCLVFADLHYLIALVAAGDEDGVEAWRRSSRAHAEASGDDAARVLSEVGLALAEAAIADRRRQWPNVVAALYPVRAAVRAIGGSHAQRDLFDQMLIRAALEAEPALARALLDERLHARAANPWARGHDRSRR